MKFNFISFPFGNEIKFHLIFIKYYDGIIIFYDEITSNRIFDDEIIKYRIIFDILSSNHEFMVKYHQIFDLMIFYAILSKFS